MKIFYIKLYTTNIKNQYEANPENIVAIIFLLKIPIIIAIAAAKIFGLSSNWNDPTLSKKIAGKIIAGNIADGT